MDSLQINEDYIDNTEDSSPFPLGKWNLREYKNRINISIVSESKDRMELEFDLVRVEAPIANALRRILIAEVPTMAIEKIYLYQNTSCIQDEILCHRLGLLPIKADPSFFEFPASQSATETNNPEQVEYIEEEPVPDPKRNLVFKINISCPNSSAVPHEQKPKKKTKGGKTGTEAHSRERLDSHNSLVKDPETGNWTLYSSAFNWEPFANQEQQFARDPPRLVNGDIIVAKLRAGQEIEASCHCVKGVGRDHAKFSPVSTATYRLLPEVKLTRKVVGEQAQKLKSSFASGVIEIDSSGAAFVSRGRNDTCSRNVFQYEDLKDAVHMTKKKNYFIFSVESTGAITSQKLVKEACLTMKAKVDSLREILANQLSK